MKMNVKQPIIWMSALIVGLLLGLINCSWLTDFFNFVASAYTRMFQFVAIPTIALAVLTTLANLGEQKGMGKVFARTIFYTLTTTFAATMVGLGLYLAVQPGNVAIDISNFGEHAATLSDLTATAKGYGVYQHILNIIPNNIIAPLSSGNVLSILMIAATMGVAIAAMPKNEEKRILLGAVNGLQSLFFTIIRGLVKILPVGIIAFSAQLAGQLAHGEAAGSLGKYLLVVLAGNAIQFFVVLPLFLLIKGINPVRNFMQMSPAVMMALFTKSSTATLPVTINSALQNMKARKEVANFVLPMCCTINMNGCAAFIYVTSLFVMELAGVHLDLSTMLIWSLIAVVSAVGNAGVPMGCFFLTLSLMSGQNVGPALGIMGVILPFYAIIDMIETAENVWSDTCVCAMVNKDTADLPSKQS